MVVRGDPGWPPDDPGTWICTAALGCDHGWFITDGSRPAEPATGERCPCVVQNIRERKRRRAIAAERWPGASQW